MALISGKKHLTTLNIDLNLLVVLDALLEEKSVTRAASRVCLSQPATSNALGRLRDVFEDPLLVRMGNRMELTRFALELKEPLRAAICSIEGVLGEPLPFDPARAHTTIRIGASDYIGITLLPALGKVLGRLAPGMEIRVTPLREPEIINRLERDDVDILLGHFPEVPRMRSEVLFTERFVCVMRQGHPALAKSNKSHITLADFVTHQHVAIAREGGQPDIIDEWLATLNLERRVGIHVPHFLVAPGIVATNDMISVVARRVVTKLNDTFGLTMLELPCEFGTSELPIHMVWEPHTDHDPALTWLRSMILDIALDTWTPADVSANPP